MSGFSESVIPDFRIEPGETDLGARQTFVPRGHTLDQFALDRGCAEGLALQSLEAGTVLAVRTRNSVYRVVLLEPAQQRAAVNGGSMFAERTEVRIEGATAGGSVLKIGWIGVGLRLEMSIGRRRITTSRVCSVAIEGVPPPQPDSGARPH